MTPARPRSQQSLLPLLAVCVFSLPAWAEVLVCRNGERFVGEVFEQSEETRVFESEIKRHLDLDLSFVLDYVQSPVAEANGMTPEHSDSRLTFGRSARF